MKKTFENKYVIALCIAAVAGGIAWATTWGNKNWLIRKINEDGALPEDVTNSLSSLTAAQLRKILKGIKS